MINMEIYYNFIMNKTKEKKINRKVNTEIISLGIFFITGCLAIVFIVLGLCLGVKTGNYDDSGMYILGSSILIFPSVIFMVYADSKDPLSDLSIGDKIIGYLYFFLKQIDGIESKPEWIRKIYFIKLKRIRMIILHQLYIISKNLKNVFIFEQRKEELCLLDKIRKVLREKIIVLLKDKEKGEPKAIEFINILITLYGYNVYDLITKDDQNKQMLLEHLNIQRECELKKLNMMLKEIEELESVLGDENKKFIFMRIKSTFSNTYVLMVLATFFFGVLFYFKNVLGTVSDIITYMTGILTWLGIIWKRKKE
ncbi:hypothetical protein [Crassaminicella profunda]|uniref:hypothetical protein n=1 Tax=Crassaminicella profunda TaxID=1286698 RepID=UPI001CA7A25A|nr:hypothetical protein [Crassaminicella profunda]QZY56663.1 hypothetical protein K7H06_07010 [Crassaminicella profunda]